MFIDVRDILLQLSATFAYFVAHWWLHLINKVGSVSEAYVVYSDGIAIDSLKIDKTFFYHLHLMAVLYIQMGTKFYTPY